MRRKIKEIFCVEFCNIAAEHDDNVEIIALKLPTNYDSEELVRHSKYCNIAQFQFRNQILVVLDYVYNQVEFDTLVAAATDSIQGLEKVVASKKKYRSESLMNRRQSRKRKRNDGDNPLRKRGK